MEEIRKEDVFSPWVNINIDDWKTLIDGRKPESCKKKGFLYHQGGPPEHMFIVKSGRIRVASYHENGNEKQIYIAEVGALCGETSCILNKPHHSSGVSIVDSEVYKIPAKEGVEFLYSNKKISEIMLKYSAKKNMVLFRQLMEISFTQSVQRIAQLIIFIARQYGKQTSTGLGISIKFTHQDVATMINTSRVTVSNVFNMFAEKGIIEKKGGYFMIMDMEALYEIANEK